MKNEKQNNVFKQNINLELVRCFWFDALERLIFLFFLLPGTNLRSNQYEKPALQELFLERKCFLHTSRFQGILAHYIEGTLN